MSWLANCSMIQTFHQLKKLVHLVLFVAFLALAISGLIDLLSDQTTFLVSRTTRPVTLPSFTICPHGQNQSILDKSLLSHSMLTKDKLPFPADIQAMLQPKEDGQWKYLNLLNADDLKNQFGTTIDETWDRQCKIYPPSTNLDSCTPCLTFRNPSLIGDFAAAMVCKWKTHA